jgi:hypothetical protein
MIEKQVRELARSEGTELFLNEDKDGGVQARLATASARGENLDIAVVRLANVLLNEPRYAARLVRALAHVRGL